MGVLPLRLDPSATLWSRAGGDHVRAQRAEGPGRGLLAGGRPGRWRTQETWEYWEQQGPQGPQGHPRWGLPTCRPAVLVVSDSQTLWPLSADHQRGRVVMLPIPTAVCTLTLCGSLSRIRLSNSPLGPDVSSASTGHAGRDCSSPAPGQHGASGQQDRGQGLRVLTVSGLDPWHQACWLGVLFSQVAGGLPSLAPVGPHFTLRRRLHESARLSSCCNNPSQSPGTREAVPHAWSGRSPPAGPAAVF